MKVNTDIKLSMTLEIDSDEAELLYHLTSYDLSKEFASRCSREYSEERLKEGLSRIHNICHNLIEGKKAAEEEVKRRFRPHNENAPKRRK